MEVNTSYGPIRSVEELKDHKILYKKILHVAQLESEIDMGVNPRNNDQADVSQLTETDFEYISKVCLLVEKRLNDSSWLINAIHQIDNKFKNNRGVARGIRFDDELYKGGRGILEEHMRQLENS